MVNHDDSSEQYLESDLATSAATGSTNVDDKVEDAVPETEAKPGSTSTTEVPKATTLEVARQTGDMSVYLYYARAAGSMATVCFLSITMACTFCESFAGEYQVRGPHERSDGD